MGLEQNSNNYSKHDLSDVDKYKRKLLPFQCVDDIRNRKTCDIDDDGDIKRVFRSIPEEPDDAPNSKHHVHEDPLHFLIPFHSHIFVRGQ